MAKVYQKTGKGSDNNFNNVDDLCKGNVEGFTELCVAYYLNSPSGCREENIITLCTHDLILERRTKISYYNLHWVLYS